MKVRRVITGHSGGRSTFASDGPTRKSRDFVSVPGMSCALLWSTPTTPVVPHDRADSVSAGTTYLPQVGETRLMLVTFPPDSVMISDSFDQAAEVRPTLGAVQPYQQVDPRRDGLAAA